MYHVDSIKEFKTILNSKRKSIHVRIGSNRCMAGEGTPRTSLVFGNIPLIKLVSQQTGTIYIFLSFFIYISYIFFTMYEVIHNWMKISTMKMKIIFT